MNDQFAPDQGAELKNKIESVLFSTGRRLSIQELANLCREPNIDKIHQALALLKKNLGDKDSSITLHEEGDFFKLGVRDAYLSIVRKVVKKSELTKSILETLAIVAFKSPVLQSKVIAVRTNKAYDHLNQLEELGYITREKSGRTKLIKVAKKFFEYFDIPADKLKDRFGNAERIEQALAKKEIELAPLQVIPELNPALEPYTDTLPTTTESDELPSTEIKPSSETLGQLEVYVSEKPASEHQQGHEVKPSFSEETTPVTSKALPRETEKESEDQTSSHQKKKSIAQKEPAQGLFGETTPASVEQKVDERVNKLIKGEEDSEDEDQNKNAGNL
ncbi:MAG: SMC-Scp complex subunit ScpB [Candidatus Woesearchaeota archaeon]|nr:SMC-Scp complex subunit ScpB [Candidatus Woesearchaeota archaeon]